MEFFSLRLLLFLLITITSANFWFISMADHSPPPIPPPPTTDSPPKTPPSSPPNTTSNNMLKKPPSRTPPSSTKSPHNTSSSPSRTPPPSTPSPHNTSIVSPPPTSRTPTSRTPTSRNLPSSTTSPQNTSSTPRNHPVSSTKSPPDTDEEIPSEPQEKQLLHIIDNLVGAGNFENWANFLASVNPEMFPVAATLFIPSNKALSSLPNATTADGVSVDPSLFAYHIVPQYLTFSDLKQLPLNSRIPTLLSTSYIVITNTSSNFTVDDSEVTHPDLYISKEFSVHGVSKVLDYKAYGAVNITFNEIDTSDLETTENGTTPEPNNRNQTNDDGNELLAVPHFRKPGYRKRRIGRPHIDSAATLSSTSDFSMIFLLLGVALFCKIG